MTRPRAVLFDYGGVIAEVASPPDGASRLAQHVVELLARAGCPLDHADVLADLQVGLRAFDGLKRAQSRMADPRETRPRELWDLIGCDWQPRQREVLLAHATPLCRLLELTVIERPARPDAAWLLTRLREHGVRTALVCNCLSGEAARDQLRRDGLEGLLDVELYSDEVGYRKPGPTLVRAALTAVGVDAGDAWFVGDKIDRDVLAARRAGVGTAVLMRTPGGAGTALRGVEPDHVVDSLTELAGLLDVS
ncbi:MAG TPA: HAD family hydrolase [Actinomycetales bacterium]|nr:HAD family hydrolase [Actinomycetales bacterium]